MAYYSYPENTERRNPLKYGELLAKQNNSCCRKSAFYPRFTGVKRDSQTKLLILVTPCVIGSTGLMLLQSLRKFSRSIATPLPRLTPTKEQKSVRNPLVTHRLLNFAGGACLLGGGIGILKAAEMDRAIDIVICLVGSVAVCCCICYLWFAEP